MRRELFVVFAVNLGPSVALVQNLRCRFTALLQHLGLSKFFWRAKVLRRPDGTKHQSIKASSSIILEMQDTLSFDDDDAAAHQMLIRIR